MHGRLAIALLLAACSGNPAAGIDGGGDPADAAPEQGPLVSVEVTMAATFDTQNGAYLLAAAPSRLLVFRPSTEGTAICPDCAVIPPEECPDICERHHLDFEVLDHDGAELAPLTNLVTYFSDGFDRYLGVPVSVSLEDGGFVLAWLECDGSSCPGGFISSQTCRGKLQRFGADGQPVAALVSLFDAWWGQIQLVHNAETHELLVLHAALEAGSIGSARATVLTEDGETVLPWSPVGSAERWSATATAFGDGFMVVVSDRDPGGATSAPCVASCDCVTFAPSLPPGSAALAYPITSAAGIGEPETVATSVVLSRPQLVAGAGGRLVLAGHAGSETVRVFERGATGEWALVGDSPGPESTLWLDAHPLGAHATFWLGSDYPDPDDANVSQLVIGESAGLGTERRVAIEDPVRGYFFDISRASLALDDDRARVFLLRGIWTEAADAWDRFEVVRVDVASEVE